MKGLAGRLFLLIILISLYSCHKSPQIRDIDAKIIDYRIEYLDKDVGGIPTNVLPGKMELVFAGPYAMNSIKGFMGQFSLSYIANRKKETVTTLLKIFNDKYYYQGEPGEMPVGIDVMNNFTLAEGTGNKTIAGLKAREMILKRPGEQDLPIYTTKSLRIKAPNITTPYRGEKEVLLIFYTSMSEMEMMLTAQEYREEKVSNEVFFVPDGYKRVSRASMELAIKELFRN